MEKLEKIWNWLSGKKTAISAILLIIAGIPHLGDIASPTAVDVIYYIGTAIGIGGIAHKAAKNAGVK